MSQWAVVGTKRRTESACPLWRSWMRRRKRPGTHTWTIATPCKDRTGVLQSLMPTLALPPADLADFCRRHGLRSLALFGSFLHGDASEQSDVDLLFDLLPGWRIGLLALFQMQSELSTLLGRPVDFVPRDGLKPGLREHVLSEARTLYTAG